MVDINKLLCKIHKRLILCIIESLIKCKYICDNDCVSSFVLKVSRGYANLLKLKKPLLVVRVLSLITLQLYLIMCCKMPLMFFLKFCPVETWSSGLCGAFHSNCYAYSILRNTKIKMDAFSDRRRLDFTLVVDFQWTLILYCMYWIIKTVINHLKWPFSI